MKIGKTIRVVTSPKRNIQKANKDRSSRPVPVKMPEKAPITADWKYCYGVVGVLKEGILGNSSAYYNITS